MNPSSNHRLNFFQRPQPPEPPHSPPQTSTTTQIHDPQSTINSLTPLLSLTHQTLTTLSSLPLSLQTTPQNLNFVACRHNPNHVMPPESLFLHTLHCPSPLSENPSSLLNSLHYPKTLNLKNPIQDSDSADLCLSLDGYFSEFGSNFYYKDCPGVVEFKSVDVFKKSFILPAVLSVECGDFVGSSNEGFSENEFRVLPSELWVVRREVESWVDYPIVYSSGVLCAVLRLNLIGENDLRRWIIVGSQQFGVVIDVFMRDHICVLFGICLKAIRKEAMDSVRCLMNTSSSSVKCPVLFQVLMWVASQLSVLYGEVNAKYFAIQVFRQCVLWAANEVVFAPTANFSLTRSYVKSGASNDMEIEQFPEEGIRDKVGDQVDRNNDGVVIFVSQVVAAVAALHERSLLEAKIRGLRNHQPQTRYQRMADHDNVSKRAEDKRNRCPNYRAIIDHDGLLRRRSSDQESSKIKTREELLAEERDYKRRRMSYRGKKMKRTTLQVMRDIIDEYMEEIREAGGIGCFDKRDEEEEMYPKPPSVSFAQDLSKSSYKSSKPKDSAAFDFEQHRQGQDHRSEHLECSKSTGRDGNGREHSSGSPRRHKSYGLLHDRGIIEIDQDDAESTEKKHHRKSSTRPTFRDGHKLYSNDRSPKESQGNRISRTKAKNSFADRYDPTESRNTDEDKVYSRYSNANA